MTIDFRTATLDNGLTIIAESDPAAHTAAIGFFVNTGARDERPELMGVSHFLEHMIFKGTEQRSAADVDREFDELGASHNAWTSAELTAFHAHTLPEHLPTAERILADIMRPSLRPGDFDDEKKVILEEIAMYADQPFWVLYERTLEEFFGTHRMAHRVLGTNETITAMQRDAMAEYFNRRYSADNTVVAMAGKLDFDAMVEQINETCGHWQNTGTSREYDSFTKRDVEFTEHDDNVSQCYILMMAQAPPQQEERRYAASILAQILGDVDGSRLYWALIETGLAEEAQAQYDGYDGVGAYMLYASCDPAAVSNVESTINSELDALVDSLTEDDLERVRSKVATGATYAGELPAGRMKRLGRQWTRFNAYRSLEEELERINNVTLDDLRNVAAEFPIRPHVLGRLAPSNA